MRRIILVALVAVLCYFGYICVMQGVENDTFNIDISEFEQVEEDSEDMTKELAAYNQKNDKEYEVAKNNLTIAIKDYENTKQEYQELVATLGLEDEAEDDAFVIAENVYKIDFLWTIIGNYATKEGIQDLDLVFVESTRAKAPANAGYVYADLKFTVEGDYILIANFLYDLEDDDRLAFEINDYSMVQDKATFTVYNVPIESSTLSSISSNRSDESSSNTSVSDRTTTNNTVNTATTKTSTSTNTVTNTVN